MSEQPKSNPTAISGTWTDVERRARFLYQFADAEPHSDAYEMAEAVLVLLHAAACPPPESSQG